MKSIVNFCVALLIFGLSIACEATHDHCSKETSRVIASPIEFVHKIMDHNLSSLVWEDEDWPNEKFYDFLQRCWNYQKHLAPLKKRRTAFTMLKNHAELLQPKITHILDDTVTWDDLNLFRGSKEPGIYFAQRINRTTTELGNVAFLFLLSQPTNDSDVLKDRQNIIKEIAHSSQLFEKLDYSFAKLRKAENLVLSFWGNDQFKQAIERHYFKIRYFTSLNDNLNQNEHVLWVNGFFEHTKRIGWLATTACATVVLPVYAAALALNYDIFHDRIKEFAEKAIAIGNPVLLFVPKLENPRDAQIATSAMAALGATYAGLSAGSDYEWMRDNFFAMILLQRKLIELARFIESAQEVYTIVANNKNLRDHLTAFRALEDLFGPSAKLSAKLKKLFDLLKTSTFHGTASIFSHQGRILAAYRLMHEAKEELERAFCALGEIDAYLSVTKLYKEHEQERARYCFVDFLNREIPIFDAQEFWNPFIDAERVVVNSIGIGHDGKARIVIVTGPNAGGKSTLIKGVALNLILAQTFGIAAAKRLALTPVSKIATYLNISDDIAAGNSLFKAQVLRVEKLLTEARALPDNEFWFVAFDEIFNGTSGKEGQALSYCLIKDLAHHKNNLCIIATHFPLLKELEHDNKGIVNYKVSAIIDEHGAIHYPFILEQGTSSQYIAVDILRAEGFKSSILEEASKIIQSTP